jgi:hypothetical protein
MLITMSIREAKVEDVNQLYLLRTSVSEKAFSTPSRITLDNYVEFLARRGKGWVCEMGSEIVGYSTVDFQESNCWTLFIKPEFEGQGVERNLQHAMLDWYFTQTQNSV